MKTKIVVPIMPISREELEAYQLSDFAEADLIEWRADYLLRDQILKLAPAVFKKFQNFKVLFTIRTEREGGRLSISDSSYVEMIRQVIENYQPAYVDVEYFAYPEAFDQLADFSDRIVLSHHNFETVPDDIFIKALIMAGKKTAFAKLAVMPASRLETLKFMQGIEHLTADFGDHIIGIGMGRFGQLTRISGCPWTYAALEGQASAPGQLTIAKTKKILTILESEN